MVPWLFQGRSYIPFFVQMEHVWAGCFYFCSSSTLPKVSFVLQAIDHRGVGYQVIDFSALVWPQAGLESAEARQGLRLSLILQFKSRWEAALWAFTKRTALQAAKRVGIHS